MLAVISRWSGGGGGEGGVGGVVCSEVAMVLILWASVVAMEMWRSPLGLSGGVLFG